MISHKYFPEPELVETIELTEEQRLKGPADNGVLGFAGPTTT